MTIRRGMERRFSLPTGKYVVKASSNGFDGKAAEFDKPIMWDQLR